MITDFYSVVDEIKWANARFIFNVLSGDIYCPILTTQLI